MRKNSLWVGSAIGLAVVLLVAWPAQAQHKKPGKDFAEIADAMQASKMTLTKAITKAEQTAEGPALGARSEMVEGELEIVVSCWKDGKLLPVTVNAKTGEAKIGAAEHEEEAKTRPNPNKLKPREPKKKKEKGDDNP